jgi:hypothetical protein
LPISPCQREGLLGEFGIDFADEIQGDLKGFDGIGSNDFDV